jgi:hypothetical protein
MRIVWIAFAVILGGTLLASFLLWRAVDDTNRARPLLAPRGARVIEVAVLGRNPEQPIVNWRLGGHAEEAATGLYGLTIWQGDRRLYSYRAARNTHGIKVETGDFDGDLRSDVLVFADQDGSGGCGVYRALVTAPGSIRQVYSRQLCEDQGSIHLEGAGLVIRIGEAKDPKTANEIHCCFRFLRTTVKRWNGHELVVVRSYRRQLKRPHPWPPGGYPPG